MPVTVTLDRQKYIAEHAPGFLAQILIGALAGGKVAGDGYAPYSARLAVEAAGALYDELAKLSESKPLPG